MLGYVSLPLTTYILTVKCGNMGLGTSKATEFPGQLVKVAAVFEGNVERNTFTK